MSLVLTQEEITPDQMAEVDLFIQQNEPWLQKVVAGWKLRRTGYELHRERVEQKSKSVRAALAVKRRAAKLKRSPAWADQVAIAEVYAEAQRLTAQTGIVHHVDHFYPLQGKKVSGLHVAGNLRVLPALQNLRKGNQFEVE